MKQHQSVSATEAHELLTGGEPVEIIDVRQPDEYRQGHVEPSRLIPLAELSTRMNELDRSKTLLMLCRSGNRSGVAAQQLASHGFTVRNIDGGMLAWAAHNLPVVKGS
jgi:rhodanese-related sulfurtransferase